MYLIDITIQSKRVPSERAEELLNAHRNWFTNQAEKGNFLVVGPYLDKKMAGLVLAHAENRESLEEILSQDSYYPDLATYEVREFQANIISENLISYKGK
ncbi:TPA: YciI family protein [Streptococcus suis]